MSQVSNMATQNSAVPMWVDFFPLPLSLSHFPFFFSELIVSGPGSVSYRMVNSTANSIKTSSSWYGVKSILLGSFNRRRRRSLRSLLQVWVCCGATAFSSSAVYLIFWGFNYIDYLGSSTQIRAERLPIEMRTVLRKAVWITAVVQKRWVFRLSDFLSLWSLLNTISSPIANALVAMIHLNRYVFAWYYRIFVLCKCAPLDISNRREKGRSGG